MVEGNQKEDEEGEEENILHSPLQAFYTIESE